MYLPLSDPRLVMILDMKFCSFTRPVSFCKELDSVLFWFQIILLVDLSRRFMRKSCDLYHESISRVEDWHH